MHTVTLWNVAQFGWTCVSDQDFGETAVSTWTRDDHVLTLAWHGVAEVSAAILDGRPVPVEQLVDVVADGSMIDDTPTVLERAGLHAEQAIPGRLGTELATLFGKAASFATEVTVQSASSEAVSLVARRSRVLRSALHDAALAVLSTPTK